MTTFRAEFVPDGGHAATSGDFFRCPEYLQAEKVTHTLLITQRGVMCLAAPIVLRHIPGRADNFDATSPYGYPGFNGTVTRVDPDAVEWPRRLVSVFIRERLDYAPLAIARTRSSVQVFDPATTLRIRQDHRAQILRNEERGFQTFSVPGPLTSSTDRENFYRLYRETMKRVNAPPRYHFPHEYFDLVLASPNVLLCTTVTATGEPAAGGLLTVSDGFLHYFLGGTADAFLAEAPSKNVVAHMISIAVERGLPLNLGGGLAPGDGLELFKKGFANTVAAFRTSEIITNSDTYSTLTAGRETSGFFPAYRVPSERVDPAPSVLL